MPRRFSFHQTEEEEEEEEEQKSNSDSGSWDEIHRRRRRRRRHQFSCSSSQEEEKQSIEREKINKVEMNNNVSKLSSSSTITNPKVSVHHHSASREEEKRRKRKRIRRNFSPSPSENSDRSVDVMSNESPPSNYSHKGDKKRGRRCDDKRHRSRRTTRRGNRKNCPVSEATWDTSYESFSDDEYSYNRNRETLLQLGEDAETDLMTWRKRAMSLKHFKILQREDGGKALEDTKEFRNSVNKYRPSGPIRYVKIPPKFETSNYPKTKYSSIKISYPGMVTSEDGGGEKYVERFNVVWSTPKGEIRIDYGIKLYDIASVQSHEIDLNCQGPKSPWFALINPKTTATFDGKINFDANMFWSVAVLYNHFKTSGIQLWDEEIEEIRKNCLEEVIPLTSSTPNLPIPKTLLNNNLKIIQPQTISSIITTPPPTSTSTINATPTTHAEFFQMQSLYYNQKNGLETSSNFNQRYTGCVTEWRGNFGFLHCTLIEQRIFLHSANIFPSLASQNLSELPFGTSVNFELAFDPHKGYKAVNAKLFL